MLTSRYDGYSPMCPNHAGGAAGRGCLSEFCARWISNAPIQMGTAKLRRSPIRSTPASRRRNRPVGRQRHRPPPAPAATHLRPTRGSGMASVAVVEYGRSVIQPCLRPARVTGATGDNVWSIQQTPQNTNSQFSQTGLACQRRSNSAMSPVSRSTGRTGSICSPSISSPCALLTARNRV